MALRSARTVQAQPTAFTAERRRRTRGQSLVEFAIILPVFLLVVGAAIDLGRLFFAYVSTENAAKEGAMYGATNPRCDRVRAGCVDPGTVTWHIQQELDRVPSATHTAECLRGGAPVSMADCDEGDSYRVTVSHSFALLTPILTPILGNNLQLTSRAVSMVVNEAFDPNATPIILPTPTATPTPPPSATPSATASPSAAPTPCTVPSFAGARKTDAQNTWDAAGFSTTVQFAPGTGNYVIRTQSLQAGSRSACTASITVGP
ncbi:MAG: pilus assembly protein [Chloroflexota bacterium]|nr:pilus assembly protein [Chloroflexota bacterium]